MNYSSLGKTGLQVSKLGYGAWGIGKGMWIGADVDESLRSLRRAIDQGVNFVDTAPGYGEGHSEKLVGQAVREAGRVVYVSSKVPPKNRKWPAPEEYRQTTYSRRTGSWSAPSEAWRTFGSKR